MKKNPGPDGITGKCSTKHSRKNKCQSLSNCSKVEEEGILSNSFYEISFTLIAKPDKDTIRKKKKLQAYIPDEYRCKNSQQSTSKLNSTAY